MKYTAIIFFLGLCGCASKGLFSKTGRALVNVQTESGELAYNKGDIKKAGEACSYNIFGLVAYGDSGIQKAKQNGKLERVFYFDTEFTSVLSLAGSVCTKVYGQ